MVVILNEFCAEKTLTAVCWPISGINLPRYPRYAVTVLANCPLMVSLYGGCCNTTHYHHQIGSLLDISTSMFENFYFYKDNHFYLRRLAELTRCFMETSPEIPILRALTNYYEGSWLLKHVKRLKGKMERKFKVLAGLGITQFRVTIHKI